LALVVQQAALAIILFYQLSLQQQEETQARMKVLNQTVRQVAPEEAAELVSLQQRQLQREVQAQQTRASQEETVSQTT
jgi:uncharacterized protein YdhG (YjbR/CyaY superfamily)